MFLRFVASRSLLFRRHSRPPASERPRGDWRDVDRVASEIRRHVGLVLPGHHVEIEPGVVLPISPGLVSPGQHVAIVRAGAEFALWTTDADPALLMVYRPATDVSPPVFATASNEGTALTVVGDGSAA